MLTQQEYNIEDIALTCTKDTLYFVGNVIENQAPSEPGEIQHKYETGASTIRERRDTQ